MKYVFPEYKENVVLGNGKLQLNPMSYQVIYEGKEIDLTPREFEVLYLLALKPNWVMPKTNIYHSVWGIYYHDDQIPYRTVEYEIKSEYSGTIKSILVKNEELVEYGQPLFVLV